MTYNLTGAADNITGVVGLIQVVNDVLLFGWLGILILIMLGWISLGAFLFVTDDAGKSFIATFFFLFVVSILFRAIELIPDLALFVCLLGLGASVAFNVRERG